MLGVSILRIASIGLLAALFATPCMAGGVSSQPADPICPHRLSRREIRELRQHAADMTQILCESADAANWAMAHESGKWTRQTAYAKPSKDRYGDPMYGAYGARAYAGTPCYNGPAYTASFETNPGDSPWGENSRYHYQKPYAVPGFSVRYGNATSPGASHSYIQSGMVNHPGAWSPSISRPAGLNH